MSVSLLLSQSLCLRRAHRLWGCSVGKAASHKVLGAYAWFWGDFFFRMEQELTFDGIFEMVPHPMYTVRWCWC